MSDYAATTRSDELGDRMRRTAGIMRVCAEAGLPKRLDSFEIGASKTDFAVNKTLGGSTGRLHCWVVCAAEPVADPGAVLHRATFVVGCRDQHPIRAGRRMLVVVPPRQEYGVHIQHPGLRRRSRGADYEDIEIGPGRIDLYGWSFDWNDFLKQGAGL